MKLKLRIASVALLAVATAPAWALQLGQIQVKSALNQPLVAAIPLQPQSLTELDGLTVGLASREDFAHAGLQLTPTDQTLRFHVVSDNNGQKLVLVTSSQPVTDPYLDFLVQVNTRQGKQLREFVVLLNPVIAAPAPAVEAAPAAGAQAELPAPSQFSQPAAAAEPEPQPQALPQPQAQPQPEPQPQAQPQPQPQPLAQPQPVPRRQVKPQARVQPHIAPTPRAAPPPRPEAARASGQIAVQRGETLYGIAKEARQGTAASVNQMMLALKSANPDAFFKDNINDLKTGAILRIPTRDEIDKASIAEANAEVHRQYEAWRSAKPHAATVVEGAAARAAARSAPQPGPAAPASDHLALVPPTGDGNGAGNRPGVAGGTGSETVAGLQRRLQDERGTLTSLNQSNADLESRVRSLEDMAGKSDKLLSLKDATIAELQRKLATVQSGQPVVAAASSAAMAPAASAAAGTSTAASAALAPAAANATRPTAGGTTVDKPVVVKSPATTTRWFERLWAWIVAGLIVLALILIGLLRPRRRGSEAAATPGGPLHDPADISPQRATAAYGASLRTQLAADPDNLDAHLSLCRLYYAQGDAAQFVAAATAMHAHVHEPGSMEWHEVAVMGEELAPGDPLFAAPRESQPAEPDEDPYGMAALRQPVDDDATRGRPADAPAAVSSVVETIIPPSEEPGHEPLPDAEPDYAMAYEPAAATESVRGTQPVFMGNVKPDFGDDPVDTKLDLARAYLDMGDPIGARAMLDEVIEEGSQTQKDEAKRLLADATG